MKYPPRAGATQTRRVLREFLSIAHTERMRGGLIGLDITKQLESMGDPGQIP
jgi:hypothetical protein